jgi:hypothetical protein
MPAPAGKTTLNGAEGSNDSDTPSVAVGGGETAAKAGAGEGAVAPPPAVEDGAGPLEAGVGDISEAVPDSGATAARDIGDIKVAPRLPGPVAGRARAASGAGSGVTVAALAACARAALMTAGAPGTTDGKGTGAPDTVGLEDEGSKAAAGAGSAAWGTAPSAVPKAPDDVILG